MNPFLLSPSERLAEWRTFRASLDHLGDMDQLARVAAWVSQAPTSNYVLDYQDTTSWPGPWELLNGGDFDDTAKAYLMEQTLIMVGWAPERLRLHYVRNTTASMETMVLLVDNKWALNYLHSEVLNFDIERANCAYLVSYRVDPEGGHTEV
jgi:hypothetical protein